MRAPIRFNTKLYYKKLYLLQATTVVAKTVINYQ